MESDREILQALERLRENQERQLAGLREALDLQRQQVEMARTQFERAEKINERAERIQETSARMLGAARKALVVILPIIFFLLVYLTWLIFR